MTRRSHQCHKDGCDSQAEWQMHVKFVSRTREGTFFPVDAKHSIQVCERHKQDAAESFVSERNMDTLAIQLGREGLLMPHPRSIEISFSPVRKSMLAEVLRFG